MGIEEVRLFDIDAGATAKLVANLRAAAPTLKATVCASTAEAVRGADIVTTITADKANATIITPEMIEPGMHVNGVGGDCPGKTELHADVLRAGAVFVEYEPQSRIEGDLQQMPADFAVTEFWRVLDGTPRAARRARAGHGVRLGGLRAGGLLRAAPAARLRGRTGPGPHDRPGARDGRPEEPVRRAAPACRPGARPLRVAVAA